MEKTHTANSAASIRRATPADADGIEALYRELVDNAHVHVLPTHIADIAKDPRAALIVLEHAGALQATALLNFCVDAMFRTQPFAVIENIVVGQAFRGRGAGTELLRYIEDECIARDCSKIMLLSAVERGDAHRFFARCGFTGSKKKGFIKYRRDFARDNDHAMESPSQ